MPDFASAFHSLEESLRSAAGSVMGKLDQITFSMLINCLKSDDYQTVADTLKQLQNEKRPISIPPVYFLSVAHPDPRIKALARKTLESMEDPREIDKLTSGKEAREAVAALLEKYGNYRSK